VFVGNSIRSCSNARNVALTPPTAWKSLMG
jgi:hypothetical protein